LWQFSESIQGKRKTTKIFNTVNEVSKMSMMSEKIVFDTLCSGTEIHQGINTFECNNVGEAVMNDTRTAQSI
jgi:hypothetical protein